MLANGDFEVVSAGKPAYWEKFGGTMVASGEAAGGTYAGCLESETSSTKWLYQVVQVDGGGWYEASASARVDGSGEAVIRISWYASADGSGSQMDQAESNATSSAGWEWLGTGSVQAPDDAQSARVRLVLRPLGNATACFDDAVFVPAAAAEATAAAPTAGQQAAATATSTRTPGPGTRTPTAATRTAAPNSRGTSTSVRVQPAAGLLAGPLSLRISEFMSDPPETGRDAPYEWVELINVGAAEIDLAGWQLEDGTASNVLGPLVVPAGGYVLLAAPSANLPAGLLRADIGSAQIGNGLGNDGDVLRLTAPGGGIVDEVSYGDNEKVFDPAPDAPDSGQTLGVVHPGADAASENWAVTLRATPGEPNVFPPSSASTVAGVRQGTPEASQTPTGDGDAPAVVDDDDDGGSVAPWVILGGLAGISVGMVGAALRPRIKKMRERAGKRKS